MAVWRSAWGNRSPNGPQTRIADEPAPGIPLCGRAGLGADAEGHLRPGKAPEPSASARLNDMASIRYAIHFQRFSRLTAAVTKGLAELWPEVENFPPFQILKIPSVHKAANRKLTVGALRRRNHASISLI